MELTHSSRMEFAPLHNLTSPFPLQGFVGGVFHFYFKNIMCTISGDPDQTPRSAASDLGLHCFHICHIKDDKVIC